MRGVEINYVHIEIVRHQAKLLEEILDRQWYIPCEETVDTEAGICAEPAEYLVPDATRTGVGGSDIEIRPAWFCRQHLSELLGRDPGEQPFFRRIEGPEE